MPTQVRSVWLAGALLLLGAAMAQPASYPLLTGSLRNDPEVSPTRTQLRTTGVAVTPFAADAFADSFGVNTRFGQGGIYVSQRALVASFLVELGFRHIRDGNVGYKPDVRAFLQRLCTEHGIHSALGLSDRDSDAAILQYKKDVPCVDMVEGPNELNNAPDWVQRLATFVPHVYSLIRNTPAFDDVPVVAPSITKFKDSEILGQAIDVSKYVDYGNMHNYPGQRNIGGGDGTGSKGWGSAHDPCPNYGYGSFFFDVCGAELFTKDRPIWTTETGYASTPTGLVRTPKPVIWATIPYDVATKYFPRLMAYEFSNGISRTYIMALMDGASGCNGWFYSLGLIEQDCPNTGLASSLHKKPQFYALKNLMATVADPGPAFSPTPITMKITGADPKLQTLLLQKRSGQYLLLYWVEASDWNILTGTPQTVTPEDISVSISGIANSSARNFGFDGSGGLTRAVGVRFSNDAASLTATDTIQFLTFSAHDHS